MMDYIYSNNLGGILIGISTFLIIGIFHPIVIKTEYHLGVKCWWIFLIGGLVGVTASIFVSDILLSSLLGVFGFSSLWSILEVFQQKKRVEKGWFPENPKRKQNKS